MANGEVSFSSRGQQARKPDRTPLPAGEWELKLLGDRIDIRKKAEEGSKPYVAVAFEALNSTKDGGKNKWVFHNFFLSMEPMKNGQLQIQNADQLLGFSHAIGTEFEIPGTFEVVQVPSADGEPQNVVNPKQVQEWLKQFDGSIVKARTRVDNSGVKNGYDPKGVIDFFIESDQEPVQELESEEDKTSQPASKKTKSVKKR